MEQAILVDSNGREIKALPRTVNVDNAAVVQYQGRCFVYEKATRVKGTGRRNSYFREQGSITID